MQASHQNPTSRTLRAVRLVLTLSIVVLLGAHAQSLTVHSVVSTSTIPVRFASVTFINNSDTTNQVSVVTDMCGRYSLTLTTFVTAPSIQAARFELEQNYPNPFNPSTVIEYRLPNAEFVVLRVNDVTGRLVATLVGQRQQAGSHKVTFDAGGLPSGIYFCSLQAGSRSFAKKLVLLK